jgi:hypothetical protein
MAGVAPDFLKRKTKNATLSVLSAALLAGVVRCVLAAAAAAGVVGWWTWLRAASCPAAADV